MFVQLPSERKCSINLPGCWKRSGTHKTTLGNSPAEYAFMDVTVEYCLVQTIFIEYRLKLCLIPVRIAAILASESTKNDLSVSTCRILIVAGELTALTCKLWRFCTLQLQIQVWACIMYSSCRRSVAFSYSETHCIQKYQTCNAISTVGSRQDDALTSGNVLGTHPASCAQCLIRTSLSQKRWNTAKYLGSFTLRVRAASRSLVTRANPKGVSCLHYDMSSFTSRVCPSLAGTNVTAVFVQAFVARSRVSRLRSCLRFSLGLTVLLWHQSLHLVLVWLAQNIKCSSREIYGEFSPADCTILKQGYQRYSLSMRFSLPEATLEACSSYTRWGCILFQDALFHDFLQEVFMLRVISVGFPRSTKGQEMSSAFRKNRSD